MSLLDLNFFFKMEEEGKGREGKGRGGEGENLSVGLTNKVFNSVMLLFKKHEIFDLFFVFFL